MKARLLSLGKGSTIPHSACEASIDESTSFWKRSYLEQPEGEATPEASLFEPEGEAIPNVSLFQPEGEATPKASLFQPEGEAIFKASMF